MEVVKALIKEVIGMFVDNGSLAIAILLVVAISAFLALRFEATSLAAVVLLLGLLGALGENVIRTARKQR